MITAQFVAGVLYEKFCQTVGFKSFDGNKLPTWEELQADETKSAQENAWIAVAEAAIRLLS